MIQLIPQGGLGNQLFQIAAGYSLALDNDEEFSICGKDHFLPLQGFNIESYQNNILRNFQFLERDPGLKRYDYLGSQYKAIPRQKDVCLMGYFQSEKYFAHNKDKILKSFALPGPTADYIKSKYTITEDTVSIHVRRGDYLKLSAIHPLMPAEYYHRAINMIGGVGDIFIFSDDLAWCKENIVHEKAIFIDEEDYICLYIMSQCGANIGCNSSFSWWGSYLNGRSDKIAIFPSNWFGNKQLEDYKDIFLNDFILL